MNFSSDKERNSTLSIRSALYESGAILPSDLRPEVNRFIIGVLPGEGVGPELISVVVELLELVAHQWRLDFDIRFGGDIGTTAERNSGTALTPEVKDFCESIFADGGALLCGPGRGRFVYDLRSQFDLFCKFTPLRPLDALQDIGVLKAEATEGVDMIVVRENVSGLYFGRGQLLANEATLTFRYSREEVNRILAVAIRLAHMRRQRIVLVVKTAAVKVVSQLWIEEFNNLTLGQGLDAVVLEVDNANYQMIAAARNFDVLVAPNMFGDILSDCGALLLGSRGMSYSGNFASSGAAVYQTGHGAALDLAGKDQANPLGQIFSAVFMLRESFNLIEPAAALEFAVEQIVSEGIRTLDIADVGSQVVGTREMGLQIASALETGSVELSAVL